MLAREETIPIINFMLLAYTDLFNIRAYDMVGTTTDPKNLVVYSYDRDESEFKMTYSYKHNSDIHVIIPSSYDGSRHGSLLLVTKMKDGTCKNDILFPEDNKIISLPSSVAIPMLYTKNETLNPALLIQMSDKLVSIEITQDGKYNQEVITSLLKKGEKIHKDHTSTLVDLDGDHKADLALVIDKNGTKRLKVLANTPNGFKSYFEMDLPAITGPLIFNDLNKNNMNDLAFVSNEDGQYFLNVYYNINSRNDPMAYKSASKELPLDDFKKEIFSKKERYYIKQNLSTLSKDSLEFRLCCKTLENVPSGIFDTDIDLDKDIELFLTANKNGEGDVIIPLKFNEDRKCYEIYKDMEPIMGEKNILSFSTCDYKNDGRELWVINKIANNSPKVIIFPNILKPENMKLSVTTVLDETKTLYGNGIIGTSYLLSYDEGENISIGNSLPAGPFLHLKNQTTTFGLGSLTFYINSLRATVPSYGDYTETYVVKYDIIQNLDLIIGASKHGKYNIRAFIIATKYLLKITIVFFMVIFLNFIIVGILQFRHAKKQREARTRDSMHPLFRSLG